MEQLELVADRFAAAADGRVVDLATGYSVVLTIASAGGQAEQTRWAARCDGLQKLRHRAIARLLDYGAVGETQRFEAWRCGDAWAGARAQAEEVARRASAFLRACGLTAGGRAAEAVRCAADAAVVLPDAAAGYPERSDEPPPIDLDGCGLMLRQRRALPVVAELFGAASDAGPRAIAIWGPEGSGRTALLLELARAARLQGFVPIAAHLLKQPSFRALVGGRSLFLMDDEVGAGWTALLDASIQAPRPHVLVVAGREDVPAIDGVALERLSPDVLASTLRPGELPPVLARRVRKAADRAGGSPGRFAQLLWGRSEVPRRRARDVPKAAEQAAVYGAEDSAVDPAPAPPADQCRWPAPGELAALRRRMDAARRLLECGRHASGERMLRQTTGALARRGAWTSAGEGALALAASMLKRGRPKAAHDVLDEARDYGNRADDEESLARAAVLAGCAWIDLARPDEAENVLRAAAAVARARSFASLAIDAAVARARAAFWRGRYADADQMLGSIRGLEVSDRGAVALGAMTSRIAVGRRETECAIGSAVDAVDRARRLGEVALVAHASASLAFAHLAAGDLDAVDRDVALCLTAVRAARDPLRGIRARLLAAESARRRGRRAAVDTLLQRLQTLGGAAVPPIVQARCSMLKDLIASPSPEADVVKHHVGATGLEALALLIPSKAPALCAGAPEVDDLVEILRVCQNAEEEGRVLGAVCGCVRRQLRAAGTAFIAFDAGTPITIASEGGRIEADIACRAVGAEAAIPPHRHADRIEAASPVRYGGAFVGALVVRWTLGSSDDRSAAAAVLAMAATAAAPAVAAVLARRVQAAESGSSDLLLGTSGAMAEVRGAIERAARAPYPVLIEGESGSGKELIARALHRGGTRRDRAFCTLNCAALPDDLVESELFGHARGAFTGAVAERTGVFEEAHGGTLFLDEVGELSPRAQAKVLRVIQEGELRRLGENVSRRVDVRIVAASNRDLRAEVAAARFRLDLLYRLDVVRIVVPPVRERREDIAALAEHFWREATSRVGSRATLSAATVAALARYDWPGNVRELQNVLASLAVRSAKRGLVPPAALPLVFGESRAEETWRLDEARRTFEERFVRAALVRTGGHRARAALELGVSRQGLTKLMTRLGIGD